MDSEIIDFQLGLEVAVRSGYRSWYGKIVAVTPTTATVQIPGEPAPRKFSRSSRFQAGSNETKYLRPYLTTVAVARAADRDYASASARAAANAAARKVTG